MINIDNVIISVDVFLKKFSCDIQKCSGSCCLYGDAGAPLEDNELIEIKENFNIIKNYISEENIKILENEGYFYKDSENDWVTTLINNKQCAFSYIHNGIFFCAIEKAYLDNKIKFRKPVSCHLYPLKIKKYKEFYTLNFDKWEICNPALIKGDKENMPVFRFVKEALIRKFGEEFYCKLEITYNELLKDKDLLNKLNRK
jgi:hypothetical protein